MGKVRTMTLDGEEFVLVPRPEYEKLVGIPAGSVDALAYATASIADSLRKARESTGLTQTELAARLKKSQTMVASAEAGRSRVGQAYIRAVLKACGLPADWTAPKAPKRTKRRAA